MDFFSAAPFGAPYFERLLQIPVKARLIKTECEESEIPFNLYSIGKTFFLQEDN